MARIDDIRAWGAENGFDVSGDRLPPGLRSAFDNKDRTAESAFPEAEEKIEERPPAIAKRSTSDRVRSLAERAKKAAPPTRVPRNRPRVSVANLITSMWTGLASAAGGFNPSVSRVLAMQAPVAGMVLEDKVRNTVADRFLQPFARGADAGNSVLALVGPPAIVAAITARPDRAEQLIPFLRIALRSWVMIAGDHMEKLQVEEKEFENKYGSRIDEMMEFILAPLMPPGRESQ
jgi:hypothetical protein